ncbi:MAG TPA: glutamine amidotransferase [Vicinamibacterales bacterium]|nr:glutamine amidotransferase [Vicinamibacterales bacterium]
MLESLFRFLFEYRPVVFQQGEFRFAPTSGSYFAVGLAAVAAVLVVLSYLGKLGTAPGADTRRDSGAAGWFRLRPRPTLVALRLALIALVALCLFRPVLVVKAAVDQQNFLALLIDDSRSMQIADGGSPAGAAGGSQVLSRGEFARKHFTDPAQGVLKSLSDRFVVRTFRFSSSAARMSKPEELTFAGAQTRLGAALEGARQELAGLPLAGIVLVSDGADTTDTALADALLSMKAAALPVFTVGVGEDRLARDIQVDRVTTPRRALKGTSLLIDAVVRQTGYAGETVTLDVEDGGRLVGSQTVKLPADGEPASVRVRVMATDPGARVLKFRISPRDNEAIAQNNAREAMIEVVDRRERILHYEGEPRFEMKFLRQAVKEDKNLEVVTLQRTAENKFLRVGIDDPEHLLGGFPRTREELFAYRGLVLSNVEASAFSGDQLRMIAEFVEKRGGGLLMLGGPRAFAEGGYAGTPVADALPVVLDRAVRTADADNPPTHLAVRPTRAGASHAVTQIAGSEAASAERWPDLPRLTSVNTIRAVKPGATVLLSGTDERRREQVVLASQRYGRGKSIAQMVQDSWLWQMHATIGLEDQTHENYWRQMLRWLVDEVPDTVDAHAVTDRVEPGETVTLVADVVDRAFLELNDARVVAYISGPSGEVEELPVQWTGERDGEYHASFTAKTAGIYSARIEATRAGKTIGRSVTQVRAVPSDAEYFDATMQAARLQRIADETGGRFYTASNVSGLPEDLQYTGRGVTTIEERELWHMPVVLLLMLALLSAEWALRRRSGMA